MGNRRDAILITLVILLASLKFWQLDQGLAYFEPDADFQARLAMRLATGQTTLIGLGVDGLFFALWNLTWATALRFIPDAFLAGRLLAATASLVIALTLYEYGRRAFSRVAGLSAAFAFTLMPLSVFFSRYPLGDMVVAMWCTLFLVCFDRAMWTKKIHLASLAGIFLALATATKFTAFQFWILAGLFAIIPLDRLDLTQWRAQVSQFWRATRTTGTIPFQLVPVIVLIVAVGSYGAMLLPYLITEIRANPHETIWALAGFPYAFMRTNVTGNIVGNSIGYIGYLPYWLSLPGLILLCAGIIGGWRIWKNRTMIPLAGFVLLVLALVNNALQARYFVQLLPVIAIIIGWGMVAVSQLLRQHINGFGKNRRADFLIVAMFVLTVLPFSIHAFQSTLKPRWIEQLQANIRNVNPPPRTWVWSSYWPNLIVSNGAFGFDSTWLTSDASDALAFAHVWRAHSRDETRESPLESLQHEGGIVVIEEAYSRMFLANPARRRAIEYVQNNFAPMLTLDDPSPNFPYAPGGNRVFLYIVPARQAQP